MTTLYALDVETTGVDPLTCDLREIALVPLDAQFAPSGEPFVRTIFWYSHVPDGGFEVHGIPPDEGVAPHEAIRDLEAYLAPRFALLGRNIAGFDAIVLRRHLAAETWRRCDYHMRDSAARQLAMQDAGLLPPGRLSLNALAELLDVKWEGAQHRALPDARIEAAVYHAMLTRLRGTK